MQLPDAALGATIAALISAVVVYITTVLAKEQKTSEFRQVWIDGLRNDIAEYLAKAVTVNSVARVHTGVSEQEKLKLVLEVLSHVQDAQLCEYRIALRLNPLEHGKLLSKLNSFQDDLQALTHRNLTIEQLASQKALLINSLLDESQQVLKMEWRRVKRGEPSFRFLKYFTGTFSLVALALYIFNSYFQIL